MHNYATKSSSITMGHRTFTPNVPLPLRRLLPHLIHPSLDRSQSPPQTASGSILPFCHSTLYGQTDTQTNRWDKRQVYSNSAYALLIVSDALNRQDGAYLITAVVEFILQLDLIPIWLNDTRCSELSLPTGPTEGVD